jgi:tetraacyldisaccharide 4'-kinase
VQPVISVGNLAMGGRGKTPVVAHLARLLVEAGERPGILSRGYKRNRPEDGVVVVSDGARLWADLDRAGDEPLLLARLVPGAAVLVCRSRAIGAAHAERAFGVTVHLLDDGFQHRQLARDLDIVIVSPADLAGRRLPFGRLRSPVRAIGRADAVIVDGASAEATASALAPYLRPGRTPVFTLRRTLGAPRLLEPRDVAIDPAVPVVAAAGIAGPERFGAALAQAGWSVARLLRFADHHAYSRRDLARIAAALRETGAQLVLTTEKDAMRLLPLRPLPMAVAAVPLTVAIEPEYRFHEWLLQRLAEARR